MKKILLSLCSILLVCTVSAQETISCCDIDAMNAYARMKRYDATHAFANPSNPKFNKEASEDAYKNVIAFLKPKVK